MNGTEKIITFADLKGIFIRSRKKALKIALLAFIAIFFVKIAFFPPKYQAEASFHESFEKQEVEGLFRSFIGIANSPQEARAATVMKAYLVLKPLVEKLGLQANISQHGRLSNLFRRVSNNWRTEREKIIEDPEEFFFKDVSYLGERGKSFTIRFSSPDSFEIRKGKKKLARGKLGEAIEVEDVSFILSETPSEVPLKKDFSLNFSTWSAVTGSLRRNLEILPDKLNRNILQLKFFHQNRFFASKIVNGLMQEYQKYLKDEQNLLAKEQLSYLEKRQEELSLNVEKNLQEHASYLQKNLGDKGFIGLEHEMESLLSPHHDIVAKNYALDLEELHLGEEEGELPLVSDGPIVGELQRISKERHQLKSEKDVVELALQEKSESLPFAFSKRLHAIDFELKRCEDIDTCPETSLPCLLKQKLLQEKEELLQRIGNRENFDAFDEVQKKRNELKILRESMEGALLFSQELDKGNISSSFLPSYDPGNLFKNWIDILSEQKEISSSPEFEQQKNDFSNYLKNYIHLLNVRENMLKERIFPVHLKSAEFEGIDLAQAKALYRDYHAKLDDLQISVCHLQLLQEQLKNPSFEISSLSVVLSDPVSHGLIARASDLLLRQKDTENLSQKDQKRIEEELTLQKKFLAEHLSEMMKIKNLSSSLIQEKISSLQEVTLDLINQQIALLKEEAEDFIQMRRVNLQKEKSLLQRKMEDLKRDMAYIPEKWRLEKQLKFKTEMALKMMQAMTQLVESKTVGFQLQQVQSKPLDIALIPLNPKPTRLFFYAFLAFVLTYLGIFGKDVCLSLFQGFPISPQLLQAWNKKLLGPISSFCDGRDVEVSEEDLESLRKISSFLFREPKEEKGLVAALLGAKGPNYSFTLADLLAKRGFKILLVDASFSAPFSQESMPGLWQYLEGEIGECPIRKGEAFDFLPMGGSTRYGVEILGTGTFLHLLEEFKKSYDGVLLFNKARVTSQEAKTILRLSEKGVITLAKETQEELAPLVEWDEPERSRLGFLFWSKVWNQK